MNRKFLFALYQTPRGKLLQTMEGQYLKRCITTSCKEHQLQVGGLGWEQDFIDCTLYQNYCILDSEALGCDHALRIQSKAYNLPVQTESMDLIVLPHLLEFDSQRFQTLREIDRVLKPGGELVILNCNPYSFSVRYQYLWDWKLTESPDSHFISRSRMLDWLKLMNFDVINTADFNLDTFLIRSGAFKLSARSILAMAYGIKAVKRRYRLIPVGKVSTARAGLAAARNSMNSSLHRKKQRD
jgi:SAM-dependent methyltransferase